VRHPHAPEHTQLRIILKSEDYLYSFAVPDHDLKEIAVPDLTFELAIETGDSGVLEFRGDQFCGFAHPDLSGNIVVQSSEEFAAWLASLPAGP
jgi:heme/copper-type cytochrome/quinol oxidase subunit 2